MDETQQQSGIEIMEGERTMGIGGVSSISAVDSSFRFGGTTGNTDNSVTAIERRIESLEKSISEAESNEKLTADERKKRVEQYKQQIQQLQLQKQQIIEEHEKEARERQQAELDAQMKEQQKRQNQDEEHPEREVQKISDDTMQAMTGISTAMDMHKGMSAIRTKMAGEARVASAEAKTDATRGMDTSAKDAQVSDTNDAINKLTTNIIENLDNAADKLHDARKADAEEKKEKRKDPENPKNPDSIQMNEEEVITYTSGMTGKETNGTKETKTGTEEEAVSEKIQAKAARRAEEERQQERVIFDENGKKRNVYIPEGYYPVDVYR